MSIQGCVVAFLLVLLSRPAVALPWRWSNPLPHGNNVADLTYNSAWGYIEITDFGQIYTSPDLSSWQRTDAGTRQALRSLTFKGTRLVVVGESGLVLWSDQPGTFNTVHLGTTNWLEGVAASTTQLVAVGDNAALYTSTDAVSWTKVSLAVTDWLYGVTLGGTGSSVWVVVGENGRILTSSDLTRWTPRTSGTTASLNRVIWTGTGFVAVGDGGVVLFGNASGTVWQVQSNVGATGDLNTIAVASTSVRLVGGAKELLLNAVGLIGTSVWTSETATSKTAPAPALNYLASLWDGTNFVTAGRTGLLVTGTRTTGSGFDWSLYSSPTRNWLFDITPAVSTGTNISAALIKGAVQWSTNRTTNTFYVAAGDFATLLTSDNGVGWSTALSPQSSSNQIFLGVAGNSRGLLAAGSQGTLAFSPVAYTSLASTNVLTSGTNSVTVVVTNQVNLMGLAWYGVASPTTNVLQTVCATENLYLIAGDRGVLATSPDGANWTQRTTGITNFLSGLTAWPGGFIAVGDAGAILTSSDGIIWSNHSIGGASWVSRVRWTGGLLVATGENGTLLTSTNGLQWTARTTGTTEWINDVIAINGTWYAPGTGGVLLISTNAIDWTIDTSLITGKSLYGAASIDGQLVVVGVEGAILRAQTGPFPNPVDIVQWPTTPDAHLFLFSGSPDQTFQLRRSSDLRSWLPGSPLEITDPSGTLLLLDDGTNNAAQFFQTVSPP
jgi:hypothetical protein